MHALGLREMFSESLALWRSRALLLRAGQPWGVNEIYVKVSAVRFLGCRPEDVDGQYVKCDVLENSIYNIQAIYRLIINHNS